jgi:hypothetical protein
MTLQDVVLQNAGIFFGDLGITQRAKAGVNTVYNGVLRYNGLHMIIAGFYFGHYLRGKYSGYAAGCYVQRTACR